MIRSWPIFAAVMLFGAISTETQAQFDISQIIGGAGTGTSGRTTSGQTVTAQTGTGQTGATGGQATGSQTGGTTGGATSGTPTATTGSMLTGNERFLRENRQAGQVVGADRAGVGNVLGSDQATGQATNNQQQGQNRFGTAGGFGAFGGLGGNDPISSLYAYGALNSIANRRAQLRMPVTLDRNLKLAGTVAPQTRVSNITSRMARIPQLQQMGSMSVELDGRVAIVRGSVATADERELVAKMLLLEPGVSDVKNELAVLSPEADSPELLPSVPPPLPQPPLPQPPLPLLPVLPTE